MFIWGPPGTLPTWARAFGYMNITAVLIQTVFPCSPPWYENTYGLAPANYSIAGDAAGLKAIDKLFGVDLYTSGFHASPVVFGAFPSLHSGWATLETLFMGHLFPKLFPVYVFYTMWLWWSTMYFSHHYAVDLVAGSLRKLLNQPHVRSNTNMTQLLVSAFSLVVPGSFLAHKLTRSSAGITTMLRSATQWMVLVTTCSTFTRNSSLSPIPMIGQAAPPLLIPQVAEVPWVHARPLTPTLKASGMVIPLDPTPNSASIHPSTIFTHLLIPKFASSPTLSW
jgi:hypothetical protein